MGSTADWIAIADGCWVRAYAEWTLNVGVVAGLNGLLVVDTRGTRQQGEQLRDDIRRLDRRPVRWVINTHVHFDHTFGNLAFDDAQIHAHESAAAGLAAHAERIRGLCREEDPLDPLNRAVIETPLRHPDTTFASVAALDLGDRYIEMFHPGRGHTDGDAVIRVPDLDVVFMGDLVEQSARPSYGPDSFPLEWPATLELAVGVVGSDTTVVPGHGATVDRDFVVAQHGDIADVAQTITRLARSGVPVEQALREGEWPWEPRLLADAVRRGYEQVAAGGASGHHPLP
jgi:glyoxylase-like metal-dependent hydrolase (beta-lactamase superfamily II)